MIGKFIKHAKKDFGVVKYDDNSYLIIAKKLPDFVFKSDYTFGVYKGKTLSKPLRKPNLKELEELKEELKIDDDFIRQAFDNPLKQFQELQKLKAPTIKDIAKEVKVEVKKYGLQKFIKRYDNYDRALLAGAVEIAFKEKVSLSGDITVATLIKRPSLIDLIIANMNISGEQRKKLKKEVKEDITYASVSENVKNLEMGMKELKEGKTGRAKKALESMKKQVGDKIFPFDVKIGKVNANKVKERVKQGLNEKRAWLYLLMAWCDTKDRAYFKASSKAIDVVDENTRGKEFEEPLELFELSNLEDGKIGYINEIKGRKPSIYELSAYFDVLLNLYAQGTIKDKYIVVSGRPSKKSLKMAKKTGYPVITSQTISSLIGSAKELTKEIKNALLHFDQHVWFKEGKVDGKKVVLSIKPVVFLRSLKIEGGGEFFLYEIAKDLFEYEIAKGKRTFALVDRGAFSRMATSKKATKTKNDAGQLLITLFKQAGSKRSGERTTYISYNFFGDMEAQHRSRSRERTKRALELLKEVGNIEDYKDYKGKFLVNLGG